MVRGLREASLQTPAHVPESFSPMPTVIPCEPSPPSLGQASRVLGLWGPALPDLNGQEWVETLKLGFWSQTMPAGQVGRSRVGGAESAIRQPEGFSACRRAGPQQAAWFQETDGLQQAGGQWDSDQRHWNQERK